MPEKDFSKIEMKNNICINVFCYENKLTLPIYVPCQKFKNTIDMLLIIDGDKLHMCISKILSDLCLTKQRIKTKSTFAKIDYSVLVVNMC